MSSGWDRWDVLLLLFAAAICLLLTWTLIKLQ